MKALSLTLCLLAALPALASASQDDPNFCPKAIALAQEAHNFLEDQSISRESFDRTAAASKVTLEQIEACREQIAEYYAQNVMTLSRPAKKRLQSVDHSLVVLYGVLTGHDRYLGW